MPMRSPAPTDRPVLPTVLHDVLRRATQAGPQGLVLFDLDSTLLDNRPRQARILREFGSSVGTTSLSNCRPDHFQGWSLRVPMRACGLSEEQTAELEPAARQFWRKRFFTSEYCIDDVTNTGAVEYVDRVLAAGASVVYCTGRHEAMREGTLTCFAREGFPLPRIDKTPRVHLVMKPLLEIHDDEWKKMVRAELAALGHVIAAFDNEPTHINTYRDHFPEALCVHLLTDESERGIPVQAEIPSVYDFVLP